jgi:hypothetical protein
MSATATGTMRIDLLNLSTNVVGSQTLVSNAPIANNEFRGHIFSPPVANVATVRIVFGNFTPTASPGLRTVQVFRSNAAAAAARGAASWLLAGFLDPLRLLALLLEPPRAAAAALEQGYPAPPGPAPPTQAALPAPVQTTIAQARLPLATTPVVIGSPQVPGVTLPPVIPPAMTPVRPAAPLAQSQSQGRVSFVIVAQVRPGAP